MPDSTPTSLRAALKEAVAFADMPTNFTCEQAQKLVERIEVALHPHLQGQGVWVSTEDALPELGTNVFFVRYGDVHIGEFRTVPNPHFRTEPGHRYWVPGEHVSHWMPFKKPSFPATSPTPPPPATGKETGTTMPATVLARELRHWSVLPLGPGTNQAAFHHIARESADRLEQTERELNEAKTALDAANEKTFNLVKNGLEHQDALESALATAQAEVATLTQVDFRNAAMIDSLQERVVNAERNLHGARKVNAGLTKECHHEIPSLRATIERLTGEKETILALHDQCCDDLASELSTLTAERDSLRRELDEARKDVERLDWLDGNAIRMEAMDHYKEQCLKKWFVFQGHKNLANMMNTLRTAIDAARSQPSGPKEGTT